MILVNSRVIPPVAGLYPARGTEVAHAGTDEQVVFVALIAPASIVSFSVPARVSASRRSKWARNAASSASASGTGTLAACARAASTRDRSCSA